MLTTRPTSVGADRSIAAAPSRESNHCCVHVCVHLCACICVRIRAGRKTAVVILGVVILGVCYALSFHVAARSRPAGVLCGSWRTACWRACWRGAATKSRARMRAGGRENRARAQASVRAATCH
jgi:hypothetical protein